MALDPSNSSNLEQLALNGLNLTFRKIAVTLKHHFTVFQVY